MAFITLNYNKKYVVLALFKKINLIRNTVQMSFTHDSRLAHILFKPKKFYASAL